jgi:hypothetical protein
MLCATHLASPSQAADLDGPVLRQRGAQLLVLGIVRVLLPERLHPFQQVVFIHFEHVGDHTRGLFEAEASVAASAPHPLQDRAIFRVHPKSLVPRWIRDLLRGDDD